MTSGRPCNTYWSAPWWTLPALPKTWQRLMASPSAVPGIGRARFDWHVTGRGTRMMMTDPCPFLHPPPLHHPLPLDVRPAAPLEWLIYWADGTLPSHASAEPANRDTHLAIMDTSLWRTHSYHGHLTAVYWRNVNHDIRICIMGCVMMNMRSGVGINVGFCHCCTQWFCECNPLKSTQYINDHVMRT